MLCRMLSSRDVRQTKPASPELLCICPGVLYVCPLLRCQYLYFVLVKQVNWHLCLLLVRSRSFHYLPSAVYPSPRSKTSLEPHSFFSNDIRIQNTSPVSLYLGLSIPDICAENLKTYVFLFFLFRSLSIYQNRIYPAICFFGILQMNTLCICFSFASLASFP